MKLLPLFQKKHPIRLILHLGDADQLNFRQFANILARFRRDQSTQLVHMKDKNLLFLFNVCTNHYRIHTRIISFFYLDV